MRHQHSLEDAFHWHKLLLFSAIYSFPWLFAVIRWETRKRVSPVLQFRNPPVVFCIAAYTYVSCVMETLQLFTPHGLCISEYFIRSSGFSFLDGPLTVRAAQYLIVMTEKYRRRFPRYKSPQFAARVSIFFGLYNILSFNALFWLVVGYPARTYVAACPYTNADAYYSFCLTILFFSVAIYFTFKLRRQHDAYLVAKETRIYYYLTAAATCTLFLMNFLGSPLGIPGWQWLGILALLYYLSCFLLLVLYPLWVDHQHDREKLIKQKQTYSSLVLVQDKIILVEGTARKEQPGSSSSRAASPSVEPETGQLGPYHFVHRNASQFAEARDVSLYLSDPLVSALLSEFAKARFVPEISRFLHAAHQYRQIADAVSDEERPGSPTAEPTYNNRLVWDMGLRKAYLGMVAEFLVPDAPYEVNVESEVLDGAAALAPAGAWRAAPAARRAAVFEAARHEVAVLFEQNFGPEFRAALLAAARRGPPRRCPRSGGVGEEKSGAEEEGGGRGGSAGKAAPAPAQRGRRLRSADGAKEAREAVAMRRGGLRSVNDRKVHADVHVAAEPTKRCWLLVSRWKGAAGSRISPSLPL